MKNLIESNLQQLNIEYEYTSVAPGKHSYYFQGYFEEFSATFAITVNEEDGYLFYYIIYPYDIPKDMIILVSEYINRINFWDVFGAFVIDYVDYSVGYHLSIPTSKHREENDDRLSEYLEHGYDVHRRRSAFTFFGGFYIIVKIMIYWTQSRVNILHFSILKI